MAIIKKFASYQNLTNFNVLVDDINPNSDYFRITEFKETFTGGKNGFLIEGSPFLKETTEVKIEILDVEGNPIYFEPGDGIPEYYEGLSKLVSVHVYDDTPIGLGKITILGELKQYVDDRGVTRDVPEEWKGVYNVKWERTFQINKNLQNETIVRFYKRPQVQITELVKPIFSKSVPTVTDTVEVTGVPETPPFDTDLRNWRAGTFYKLIRATGSWDRDVDENQITVSVGSTTYSPTIIEVLNDKEVLVDIPYTENNLVKAFESQSASVTYSDFQNEVIGESALTGSFAKIDMTQLKTFVGDVARVKVFRKSRNTAGDFQFVQESKLESTELLRDVTTQSDNQISYGNFTETNLSNYWVTSSIDHPTTVDSSKLSQAVKIDYNTSSGGVQKLITSESFSISKDVEYTLSFKTLLDGTVSSDKYIDAYFSGSYTNNLGNEATYTQSFMYISGSNQYKTRQNVSQNILAERDIDAKLVLEFKGDDWYVSNVSLINAQETSFSPDEFTLIQDIPRKLAQETFDFRFEFYDINNNYIPVDVTATATFDGGNDFPTSDKLLTFESDRNAFRFSSGSVQNPINQQIQLKVTRNNLTGSVLFESSAFDVDGNYLNPSDYTQYPGKLTSVNEAGALITINNFTGSRVDGLYEPFVGSVVYTASLENLQEFETVYRLEDGDNAPQLIVTSNANQFVYEPTALEPKPSGQSITVRAQRKNLASLITPLEVNSGSNLPPLNYVSTINGIDTYTISALQFSASFAENNFDEVTYSFTGSDVFGNQQTDEITLSKVINFDGVSIVLSTENTSFQSDSTGTVTATEFNKGDGTVDVRVGSKIITHDDAGGGTAKNTFDIVSVTPSSGLTANSLSPTTNSYGISAMSVDSGTLTLLIRYKAGDNSTTVDFSKVVNYSKNKIAAPVLSIETTNKDQSVTAFSTGEQVGDFADSVVTVKEQYGGSTTTKTITSLTATSGDISSISTTPSTGLITLNGKTLANGTNNTTIAVSATVTDSEGTSRTLTDTISLSKVKKAQPSITFSATPQSQTIDADSTGALLGSITDVVISGFEGNTALTYNQGTLSDGQYKITNVTGVTVADTTPSTSTIGITGFSGDTAVGTVSISYVDSEGTSGTQTIKFTLSKSKKAAPTVVASVDPQTQNVESDTSFGNVGEPSDVTLTVNEGGDDYTYDDTPTPGLETFKISSVTGGTNNNDGTITPDTPTDETGTSGTITYSYRNSEGTTFSSKTIGFSVGVSVQGASGVVISISPSSQTVKVGTDGTYESPTPFTVTVVENGNQLTHTTNTTLANDQFKIGTITNGSITAGSGTKTPDITPTTPDAVTGLITSFDITYKDSGGNTSDALPQTHKVGVVLDGVTGPGVVHTGVWESGRIYQFDNGLLTGTGRRDTVLWSSTGTAPYDTYYASNRTHTSVATDTVNGAPHQGNSTAWTSLGTQDFFVAAKIGVFEESFVQNTLNIGENNNGGFSAANITLYGGSTNPYFSLGQSTAGVYGGNGIFIGNDAGDYKASFVGGSNHLKWNGSTLDIKGTLTIAGESAALDPTKITNTSDPMGGGTLNYNPNFTIVASDGRPDGVKAVYGSATTSNISYQDAAKSILKLHHATDTSIGAGFPAIKVNKDAKYVIHFRVKSTSAASTGFYFRMQEYDDELPQGITHVCNGAAGSESGVVEDTRQITQGTSLVVNTPSGGDIDNGPITTSFVDYIVTYTPTSTAKWVSPIFLNWTGMGVSELHVDRLAVMLDTSDKTQGSVGGWAITSSEIQGGSPSGGGNSAFTTQGIRLGASGYISATQFYLDTSGNANFKGSITGGTLDIGGADATSFHVDSAGNIWSGAAAYADGKFKVSSAGTLSATGVNISGAITATSGTFSGTVNASGGTFTNNVTLNGTLTANNMKFGKGVTTGKNGIRIDANDYWYDDGTFSLGNGGVTWDGATLYVAGAIQTGDNISLLNNDANFQNDTDVNQADKTDGSVGGWSITNSQIKANNDRVILNNSGNISLTDGTDEKILITKDSLSVTSTDTTITYATRADVSGTQNPSPYTGEADGGASISSTTVTSGNFSVDAGSVIVSVGYPGTDGSAGYNQWSAVASPGFDWVSYTTEQTISVQLQTSTGTNVASKSTQVFYDIVYAGSTQVTQTFQHPEIPAGVGSVVFDGITSGTYRVRVYWTRSVRTRQRYDSGHSISITNTYLVKGSVGVNKTVNATSAEQKLSIGVNGMIATSPGGFAQIGDVAADTSGDYSGLFLGDVKVNGQLIATSVDTSSDRRLKMNIHDVNNPIEIVKNLKPKTFTWNRNRMDNPRYENKDAIGFIAQDVQEVLPQIVRESGYSKLDGRLLSLDYNSIIALNTSAIKALLDKIEELERKISELENN